jgi:hypothetical protein
MATPIVQKIPTVDNSLSRVATKERLLEYAEDQKSHAKAWAGGNSTSIKM